MKYVKMCYQMKTFGEWLAGELQIRGLSQADLARSSKLTRTAISNLINGARGAGPDSINAIADALNLDPAYVMRIAGHLPPERSEPSTIVQEVIQLMGRIPVQEQQHLLEIVRAYTRRYLKDDRFPPE